jgi:hypothetical protein
LRYCISLFVRTSDRVVQADRWTDEMMPAAMPEVGEKVDLQVTTGVYLSHGVAMSRLSWGESDAAGTDF